MHHVVGDVRGGALLIEELERVLDSNDGSAGAAGLGRSRGSLAHCALMCAVKANASALPQPQMKRGDESPQLVL